MKQKIISFLQSYGLRLNKYLGQNFLISQEIIEKILEAGELNKKDVVLEIGPGTGNLTFELAKKVKKVLAVEKDRRFSLILKKEKKRQGIKNVEIIQGDILKIINFLFIKNYPYKVIANIPYYLTSRLIKNLLEHQNKPRLIVLMVQKEVAKRICAKPPKMNLLAISVQFYAAPKIVSFVPKTCFWPQPKVDSAIIKIIPKTLPFEEPEKFFKIVKIGFSQPRKQLVNNFSKKLGFDKIKLQEILKAIKINPKSRAENLTIEDWLKLTTTLNEH